MKLLSRKITATVLTVLLFTNLSMAQEVEVDPDEDPDIPNIPLDGGLSILLVAGAAYGSKKYHSYIKSKNGKGNNDID